MALSTSSFVGTLALFVYFGAVLLSLPAAATVLLLARRFGVTWGAVGTALGAVSLLVLASVALTVVVGVLPALALLGVGLSALVGLWIVPVAVGGAIVRRFASLSLDAALGFAVAGLPPAMIVSAIVFVAPGGPTRYNLTFLSGPALWLVGATFVAVLLFGPGIAGVGLAKLAHRRR